MANRTWKDTALAVPGVGVSLLPKVICPFCSPAYAAVVSSLGLGFLMDTTYLLPITVAFLALALGVRPSNRRDSHVASCCAPIMSVAALGDGRADVPCAVVPDEGIGLPFIHRCDTA